MDAYEATKIVFSRIQYLDPENASKIMGLLLIQDHGEKEMIRFAFGPETLLQSVVVKARQELGISPNTPPTPSSNHHQHNNNNNNNPLSVSRQSSISSNSNPSRLFLPIGLKIPSSLSIPSLASPSSVASFPDFQNPEEFISPNTSTDQIDPIQLQEQLSFLNDPHQDLGGATWGPPHKRSYSVSDISLEEDDPAGGGLGWNHCLYFARGYCKNGASCRFLHDGLGEPDSGFGSVASLVGSPSKIEVMEQCHELLRSKSLQHQRMMAANANSPPYPGNKFINFLVQQQKNESQRAAAAALIMGEDIHKFSRSRFSRSDHIMNGVGQGEWSPCSRQIYLTFPADSTFREEDVSDYFSNFGPVQDVRIPYQQKRMFGFVTFVYSETVRLILAKGNPHFVCDSRVLVKPYKEKGKVPDKFRKQQHQLQQMEREFSTCSSPTSDPRYPFDNQLGSRMMCNNTQELLWRRQLEEENDLQQALELQSRRLMGLQLDLKRSRHHHRALSAGAPPFPSPTYTPNYTQPLTVSGRVSPDGAQENGSSQAAAIDIQLPQQAVNENDKEIEGSSNGDNNGKVNPLSNEDGSLQESLEPNLPDSPFASPTKGTIKRLTAFTNAEHGIPVPAGSSYHAPSVLPATSSFDLSPFKSRCFQMPRFPTGPGAIGM